MRFLLVDVKKIKSFADRELTQQQIGSERVVQKYINMYDMCLSLYSYKNTTILDNDRNFKHFSHIS